MRTTYGVHGCSLLVLVEEARGEGESSRLRGKAEGAAGRLQRVDRDERGNRRWRGDVAAVGCCDAGTQQLRGEGRKTTGEVLVGWAVGGLALVRVGKFALGEPP